MDGSVGGKTAKESCIQFNCPAICAIFTLSTSIIMQIFLFQIYFQTLDGGEDDFFTLYIY